MMAPTDFDMRCIENELKIHILFVLPVFIQLRISSIELSLFYTQNALFSYLLFLKSISLF